MTIIFIIVKWCKEHIQFLEMVNSYSSSSGKSIVPLVHQNPLKDAIQNAMGRVMADMLMSFEHNVLLEFVRDCNNSIEGLDAMMVCHGPLALKLYASDTELLENANIEGLRETVLQTSSMLDKLMDPLISSPASADFLTVTKHPINCNNLSECMENKIIKNIRSHLKKVRKRLHSLLFRNIDDLKERMKMALDDEAPDLMDKDFDINFVNAVDVNYEIKDDKVLGSILPTATDIWVCDPSNMFDEEIKINQDQNNSKNVRRKGCSPLRESLNLAINFETHFEDIRVNNAFILLRLGLLMDIADGETHRPVPVNFINISFMKGNDHRMEDPRHTGGDPVYKKTFDVNWFVRTQLSNYHPKRTLIPYPRPRYILSNLLVYLGALVNQLDDLDSSRADKSHELLSLTARIQTLKRDILLTVIFCAHERSVLKAKGRGEKDWFDSYLKLKMEEQKKTGKSSKSQTNTQSQAKRLNGRSSSKSESVNEAKNDKNTNVRSGNSESVLPEEELRLFIDTIFPLMEKKDPNRHIRDAVMILTRYDVFIELIYTELNNLPWFNEDQIRSMLDVYDGLHPMSLTRGVSEEVDSLIID